MKAYTNAKTKTSMAKVKAKPTNGPTNKTWLTQGCAHVLGVVVSAGCAFIPGCRKLFGHGAN